MNNARRGARALFLQRVNPLSLPFATLASLFRPVYFWRREQVSAIRTARFTQIDPSDLYTLEAWQEAGEAALNRWRETLARIEENEGKPKSAAHRFWRQRTSILFEERHLFLSMIARLVAKDRCLNGSIVASWIDSLGIDPETESRLAAQFGQSFLFGVLDRAWLVVRLIGSAWRQISRLQRTSGTPLSCSADLLWTGISPAEIADSERQLDFAFLVARGLIDPSRCVFILPTEPGLAARARLAALQLRWVRADALGSMHWKFRLSATLSILASCLKGMMFGAFSPEFLASAMTRCEGSAVFRLAQSLGIRAYLTSVTACWPEQSEVSLLGDAGIHTVNWSYGANTFCYSSIEPAFRDLGIPRSISSASHIWIWSDDVRDWLTARHLGNPPEVRETGPVMCGDSRWCAMPPKEARRRYGLGFSEEQVFISVFDVPPLSREGRLAVGHGPSNFPAGMLDRFFSDCELLLEEFDDVVLIVKPKRALADRFREYPPAMERVLSGRSSGSASGRILVLPHNIDPYIPVALSEISIGVPFTSPVMVARNSGRMGYFHDARSEVLHFRPKGLKPLMTHGIDELRRAIEQAIGVQRPYAWVGDDPIEFFARAIEEIAAPGNS